MTSFRKGDVVVCQFPYSDRNVRYRRPVLVVSTAAFNDAQPIAWVLMITGADNSRWPGDVDFGAHYEAAGLKNPSVIRTAKVSSVELGDALRLGSVPSFILSEVMTEIGSHLGLAGDTNG
ncbi:type II toxin-antitoxin system PemK/MazF family toxin [Aureimonas psammosilenae]|uniref:type II toxin-antitoxin system PemK/MazF family toxin n=1 Tax=Aureimonas psammosilenae TaxID=2495496 RepID=UPI001260744A|nr:type II toxin-antitoxin system PemK/MazF family toxin [Aureimonas psammosilenae]